jgi:hypothetical protein
MHLVAKLDKISNSRFLKKRYIFYIVTFCVETESEILKMQKNLLQNLPYTRPYAFVCENA